MHLTINISRSLLRRTTDFDESKIKRDAGGQFSSSAAGASGREKVKSILAKKPSVPEDQQWLGEGQTSPYSKSREEVRLKDLADQGVRLATKEDAARLRGEFRNSHKYERTELQHLPIKDIIYQQPSVNKGKLEYMAENYNPHPSDFHKTRGGELSKYEAPTVTKYPDGTLVSSDHHRLIAAHLRGDTHAIVRVSTLEGSPQEGWWQVKTKADPKIKKLQDKK